MKTAVALPLAASLLQQATAFSLHRHQHAVDKRQDNVVWHTVFETVYVTAGHESPAETPNFVADSAPAQQTVTVQAAPAPAPAAANANAQDAPAPAPTTLATAVKPALTLPSIGDLLPTKSTDSSSPSSTGAALSGKRGIAYNDANMANSFKKECPTCDWAYNWGSSSAGLDSSINFIPLLWGDLPVHTNNWDKDAEAALAKGAKALLSFNEPDMPTQANMSPAAAAAAHAKYFSKYAGRAQIGSPAVSNSGQAGQGVKWLKEFMASCDGSSNCPVDFCVVHWYSEAQFSDTLFDHLKEAKDACNGKPVWLTEFAPFGSDDQISGFMKEVIPKLEALDYLHAYSYFMVAENQLMKSNSLLSTIGNVYASLTN